VNVLEESRVIGNTRTAQKVRGQSREREQDLREMAA